MFRNYITELSALEHSTHDISASEKYQIDVVSDLVHVRQVTDIRVYYRVTVHDQEAAEVKEMVNIDWLFLIKYHVWYYCRSVF